MKYIKHFLLFIIACLCFNHTVKAQASADSIPNKIVAINFDAGSFLFNNEFIKRNYSLHSALNWGFSLNYGYENRPVMPWAKYSSYRVQTVYLDTLKTAKRNQLGFGIRTYLDLNPRSFLSIKVGSNWNSLTEEITGMDPERVVGFVTGVGFKRNFSRRYYHHFDIDYEYTIAGHKSVVRDWSGFIFSYGMGLQFGVPD